MSSWEEDNSWMIDAYEIWENEDPIWETIDHKLIAVSQMETSHIKNCIKLIYKSQNPKYNRFLRAFEKELRWRRWNQRLLKDKFTFRL